MGGPAFFRTKDNYVSTNPLTLTTELEAVNLMLFAISESPIASLDTPTHSDAASAITILRFWNMTVQEEGWRFNVRENVLLTRDGSNNIIPPVNTLNIDTFGYSKAESISHINGKLMDLSNNTFVWTKDLYVKYTLLYDFSQIPQSARNYITQLAGLQFIVGKSSDDTAATFTKQTVLASRAALRRSESLTRDPNIFTDSNFAQKFQYGRRPFYPAN